MAGTESTRSGVRVPKPRVTVQHLGGAWVVLVDGIEESEHPSKALALVAARRTRKALS
jgi:hypothetical protein